MDRRLLVCVAAASALLMVLGLSGVDRALAQWLRASGAEQARMFSWGLGVLDLASGKRLWLWLAGCVVLAVGIAVSVRAATYVGRARWSRALVAAVCVQFACMGTMILGKIHFGRLRPEQVLESGNWSHHWFSGGGAFPSGHGAFYFGLLLPLAAARPI